MFINIFIIILIIFINYILLYYDANYTNVFLNIIFPTATAGRDNELCDINS